VRFNAKMLGLLARKKMKCLSVAEDSSRSKLDPECRRRVTSPCCHKDMDKPLSGRVKLTKLYWLQILSASPV